MKNVFEDLERSLPNGFHDAELVSMHVDYSRAEAILELDIDTGDPANAAQIVDGYRRAQVTFLGLKLFSVDPPGNAGPFVISTVTSGPGDPHQSIALPHLPDDCFRAWFFLTSFNSFVRIAAKDVRFEWGDDERR
jgi:hypothetical protein